MTIVVRAVFDKNNKYYPHVFLDECLYKIWKMERKDKLKETDSKNRRCYYFDDIIDDVDIYFSDILLDEQLSENISGYDIFSYKTSTGPKPSIFYGSW